MGIELQKEPYKGELLQIGEKELSGASYQRIKDDFLIKLINVTGVRSVWDFSSNYARLYHDSGYRKLIESDTPVEALECFGLSGYDMDTERALAAVDGVLSRPSSRKTVGSNYRAAKRGYRYLEALGVEVGPERKEILSNVQDPNFWRPWNILNRIKIIDKAKEVGITLEKPY